MQSKGHLHNQPFLSERRYNRAIQKMKLLAKIPFHPLLLALYPPLALFAFNLQEVTSSVLWRPLLISITGTAILFLILRLIFHDWNKAGLLSSIMIFMFFSYGRFYDYLKTTPLGTLNIVRHRYLLLIFCFALVLASWLLLKYIRDWKPVTGVFNIIAIVMVILPGVQIGSYQINVTSGEVAGAKWTPSTSLTSQSQPGNKPDIYFIILDSYTRSDVLKAEINFDNTNFLNQLEALNFYVADCSRSNYNSTKTSIISTLNMSYLPELYAEAASQGISESDLWVLISANATRKNLENLGYKFVTFATSYKWSTIRDADLFLSRDDNTYGIQFITPFEQILVDSTALSIYSDYKRKISGEKYFGGSHPLANYIGQEEFILNQLPKIAEISDPTFTYAHINITHKPYVFSPAGYLVYEDETSTNVENNRHFPEGYIYAIQYINTQILSIIHEILEKSSIPPIIIIQGDHGYWKEGYPYFSNISPILNAYFIPGIQTEDYYPRISPVNTFRLIFNEYFGGQYKLLPDESYNISDINNPLPEYYPDCQQ